jgi:ABC-type antimicrobial peptide transport system permease subunit
MLRLLLRTLSYHWRGNAAVLLGVLVGSAVLTGALLVGDSLRGSLRDRSLRQLGWVDQALVAPRFFRARLADQVRDSSGASVAPAILLRTTAALADDSAARAAVRGVTVLGVEDSFFPAGSAPRPPFVWVNAELARDTGAREGSAIDLRLVKPSPLPRETVLARKDVGVGDWRVEVTRVLQGDEPGNHFNLRPNLDAPRNVLVPLSLLQEQLGVKGQVNALFAAGDPEALSSALNDHLTLEDHGLSLFTPAQRAKALLDRYDRNGDGVLRGSEWFRRVGGRNKPRFAEVVARGIQHATPDVLTLAEIQEYYLRAHPYLTLESQQLLLPPETARAALEAARASGLDAAPTLVYLCRLESAGRRIAGVVAALDARRPAPLGPFLPRGKKELADDEIVLVEEAWPEGQRPAAGDRLTLTFKPPESHGPAPDLSHRFRVAGYIPLAGAAADPSLVPEFPGITDRDEAGDWTLPFDDPAWQQQTLRAEYTDRYWDAYRATPKAYVPLAAGLKLWSSRFGSLTSIRLAPRARSAKVPAEKHLDAAARRFESALLKALKPAQSSLAFEPVKAEALEASRGGTAFDQLFLYFSFFLIVSALLLVGLLYRLNLDRRAPEVGVLFAEGFTRWEVCRLLLGEGALLAAAGVVLGGIAAIIYSRGLVDLLAGLWPGGVLRSLLAPHWTLTSLALGALGAFAVSLLTVAGVAWWLARVPPRALLAGQTSGEGEPGYRPASWRPAAVAAVAAAGGLVLLAVGPFVPGHEAQAGTFFGSGALFLTAGLVGFYAWMKGARRAAVEGHGFWTVARLGVRNAARNPARSMLTVGLLASAAFLLVAVESFRRQAGSGDGSIAAPDGGFALVAESDLPIIRDLNTPQGRQEAVERLARRLAQKVPPAEADREAAKAGDLLKDTQIVAFRARAGDDASCLNLYQPRSPRVLGVPKTLIERGGFVFDATAAKGEEKKNPWLLLLGEGADTPAFGEANTVKWMLKSDLGRTLKVPDEKGDPATLLIVGLLHDSVFQSSLLVSEERFLRLYPGQEGYTYFLIRPPTGRDDEVKRVLELAFEDRGFAVERTADRLAAYLAVENTYLTTFQALGGLGLLLGSLGLAVVLLRAVWERRAELALLRALGWRKSQLGWLMLAENGFLLLLGLAVGAVAALLSITPQLVSGAGAVPWGNLGLLFAVVLAAGLAAGALAVAGALRAPIVPALRRE